MCCASNERNATRVYFGQNDHRSACHSVKAPESANIEPHPKLSTASYRIRKN